jgi:hypothetical protein
MAEKLSAAPNSDGARRRAFKLTIMAFNMERQAQRDGSSKPVIA